MKNFEFRLVKYEDDGVVSYPLSQTGKVDFNTIGVYADMILDDFDRGHEGKEDGLQYLVEEINPEDFRYIVMAYNLQNQ